LKLNTFKTNFAEYLRIVHRSWVADYGDMYVAWAGTRPIVAIAGPELMEPILSSTKLITKANEYSYLSAWLGNCLFLATGDAWRSRRRLLTPAFHFQILNSFVDTFNDQSEVLIEQIREKFNNGPQEMDVCPLVTQCTLSIICGNFLINLNGNFCHKIGWSE
jgi:cytochrome P450 family 4